jgi:hypothetical protein
MAKQMMEMPKKLTLMNDYPFPNKKRHPKMKGNPNHKFKEVIIQPLGTTK